MVEKCDIAKGGNSGYPRFQLKHFICPARLIFYLIALQAEKVTNTVHLFDTKLTVFPFFQFF